MTPQELRKLYERETSEWTDAELIAVLNSRYEPTKVPPCRVCGGELSIGAIGGGSPTRYGCMADNAAHYSEPSSTRRFSGARFASRACSSSRSSAVSSTTWQRQFHSQGGV